MGGHMKRNVGYRLCLRVSLLIGFSIAGCNNALPLHSIGSTPLSASNTPPATTQETSVSTSTLSVPTSTLMATLQAHLIAQRTFNKADLNLQRWLNNHAVEIYTSRTINDGSIIVFDVITQERQSVQNVLPQLYRSPFAITGWSVEYGLDLNWVG
jgi:hypothetical protein